MAKPRSDAKLLNLPPADQDRIYAWLTEGADGDTSYKKVAEQIYLDFNIRTSEAALSTFYRKVVQPRRLHAAAQAAQEISDVARQYGAPLVEGADAALRQAAFEVIADPERDPKKIAVVLGLALESQKLAFKEKELASRSNFSKARLEQGERKLELARQKFQRDCCELFLKWLADAKAREIAEGSGSNADKIERLGQAMFPDWEEEEGK